MKLNPIKCALLITAFVSTGYTTSVLAHADHVHEQTLPTSVSSSNQMTMEASKLLEALSNEQLNDILYKFSDSSNRTYWTNAPVDSQARNGLPIGRLSTKQRHQLHQLLISSTSSQGYYKIWAAIQGDNQLKKEGENRELTSEKFFNKNQSLGANNYWVSFYGDPRSESKWGYMLTGHHLAANFTVVDGKATFVPMFYGSDPAFISEGAEAGYQFLPQERRRGYELLNNLDPKQKSMAIISDTVPFTKYGAKDFFGPGSKDSEIQKRGIRGDQLNPQQKELLWILIEEYVHNADHDVADSQLEKIKNDGWENIYFMWMGPSDGSEQVFFRVNSPSILIDFVDQRTGFDWNTHPHTIVRDPSNDYGENWLKTHISEHHTKGIRPEKQ
ncbi:MULTISPECIES: DUF3500 domain-containing protein [unclassified Vibrio]|uniref:DUF3500 domain-containing protein n=1 Tax=unclassified Vibrio TaxID=2614977 RepID=UPI00159D448F|nr:MULTISPECIES: DUF3500 domain-containing protein [unclassified Vibrio]NVN83950.1 DUF3500 domain-containing protein [Vibrio sp. Scap16]QLE93915.1 DUF3500 domain-containing protein [Vibrio sp. Scap24]